MPGPGSLPHEQGRDHITVRLGKSGEIPALSRNGMQALTCEPEYHPGTSLKAKTGLKDTSRRQRAAY
ncbi:hypothetical protein GCM10008955_09350 [Deinococcus malanensis]|uniref:Uncharacterized protein n=1 Tax=Deinococcus malanensis TaxID=1706855 RepID=A0ABQ2EN05_9DEIO|nr:hypothetical protein GCM10008955_09350 [Deinococcus malanensis]